METEMTSRVLFAALGVCISMSVLSNDLDSNAGLHVDIAAVASEGHVVPVDGITSSGQPNEAALEVIKEYGYVAVIDLRGENENRGIDEKAAVENLGMDYVLLPIDGRDAISFENAEKLDKLINSYDAPVLIHCGSGNRVGALLALRKSHDGASDEEAIAYGKDGGLTGLEDLVRGRLSEASEPAED
jgi:uncharacterized protein (TIGR01244 family)